MDGIKAKIGRIASKIKGGTEAERLAIAEELNLLAELLIDISKDEGACLPQKSKSATVAADDASFDAE